MFRIGSVAALAAAIWLLSVYGPTRPAPLGLDAPVTEFSAARAGATLGRVLGPEKPHPSGSAENAAVRGRLIAELKAMGLSPMAQTVSSCWSEARWDSIPCGTVTNIVTPGMPGIGKAVLLMSHYDSVAAGPGGCDGGCALGTMLETIRALKARGASGGHPLVLLFSDGEEAGLLGAAAYFRDAGNRAAMGAVMNVDDRGDSGTSYLFQTSAGDSRLVDLYARVTPHVATSSLYAEIFKRLPNDTDMTTALAAGVTGYNFAVIGGVSHYHTPLDTRANIEPTALQQHGEAVTALAQALRETDYAELKGGDAVYLDVLGLWLPRLPMVWTLPLSITCFALIALAGLFTKRGRRERRAPILSLLMPPLLLAGCVGMGFVLHGLAAWLSGSADPSFAYPVWLRWSLGLGALAVAVLTARGAGAIAGWLWFAGLAIAASVFAPGAAPYFLFPALVAAPLLLVTVRGGRGVAVFLAALPALLIWIGLVAAIEPLQGLSLHEAFMGSAAFALMPLLPLMGKARNWGWALALCVVAALGLAVTTGLQPAFSANDPQRLNLRYVEQDGKAWWVAGTSARLPQSLRDVANFSAQPARHLVRGYTAAAGNATHPAPSAAVTRTGDDVTLQLNAPGDGVLVQVPKAAGLQSVSFNGVTVPAPPRDVSIVCVTPDCGHAGLTLTVASPDAVTLTLASRTNGLPPAGAKLVKARPPEAVPSHEGDTTLLVSKIAVPAR